MTDLEKKYNPERVEKKWYQYGLEKKLFHADENSSKKAFSVVIPPPNITGSLHMGHALNSTLKAPHKVPRIPNPPPWTHRFRVWI